MKKAYINAHIPFSNANAFIVEKGRFTHVGSKQNILKQTIDEIIDLNNYTVLPGFHDSHLHVLGIGKSMNMEDLSLDDTIDKLIKRMQSSDKNPLIGRGFHEGQFQENRSLTKIDLNKISTKKPIVFYRVCGHMVVANDKAIELAKASRTLPKGENNYDFETGIFKEEAIAWIMQVSGKITKARIQEEVLLAQEALLANGVTAVGSDDFAMYDVDFEMILEAIQELDIDGKLKLRILEQANIPKLENLKRFIDKKYVNRTFNRYRMGPLKLLADGSLGARSAFMREPYADANTKGIRVFPKETLAALITTADQAGMDSAVHGIGDAIIDDLLDVYESLDPATRSDKRHSIIHAQLADKAQIARMLALNVGAQTQPIFLNSDIPVLEPALGDRRFETYLFNTMYQSGIKTTISTDAPVEAINPFDNLYVATTRKSIKHKNLEPFLPEEAFDLKDALDAYTHVPAYFSYQEHELGKIQKGFLADFIVVKNFKKDRLLEAKVLTTYIEGEQVYQS